MNRTLFFINKEKKQTEKNSLQAGGWAMAGPKGLAFLVHKR